MYKEVKNEWNKLVEKRPFSKEIVGTTTYEGWERCLKMSLDPLKLRVHRLANYELNRLKQENANLLSISLPYMQRLYELIRGTGSVVILTNEEGIILSSFGDEDFMQEIDIAQPGTSWNEKHLGNNGVGTALYLKKSLQIYGSQHFYKANHIFSCSASIIKDHEGKIIGCFDISSKKEHVHKHTLGMVVAAAFSITQILIANHTYQQNLLHYERQKVITELINQGLFAIDQEYRITNINQQALREMLLSYKESIGKDIRSIISEGIEFDKLPNIRDNINDLETILKIKNKVLRCNINIGVLRSNNAFKGAVFTYKTKSRINNVVNRVTGSRAYFDFDKIIGHSETIISCIEQAKLSSKTQSNILLIGESGTGKEMFAQSIHNHSSRKEGPFIAINCGAIPRDLIQSELFGYESGAFTGSKKEGHSGKFELADGGTIFLDEIGDMPLDAQVNLLRVLETKEVTRVGGSYSKLIDVKVIAATNQNLEELIEEGLFRSDLYFRLNVMTINIPPLRERTDDIPVLVDYFMDKYSKQQDKDFLSYTDNFIERLSQHQWLGNVRELENIIERSVNLSTGKYLTIDILPKQFSQNISKKLESEPKILEQSEKSIIEQALISNKWNIRKTAQDLKIARSTLYLKIKKYKLSK